MKDASDESPDYPFGWILRRCTCDEVFLAANDETLCRICSEEALREKEEEKKCHC